MRIKGCAKGPSNQGDIEPERLFEVITKIRRIIREERRK